jgi:hypothetical protein
MDWFYVDEKNEQTGPLDEDDMAAMISGAKISPHTLVWKEGYPDWVPARSVAEFNGLFLDNGEQATMIGGMTFARGGFHTDVQAPAYAVRSEDPSTPPGFKASRKAQSRMSLLDQAASLWHWLRGILRR